VTNSHGVEAAFRLSDKILWFRWRFDVTPGRGVAKFGPMALGLLWQGREPLFAGVEPTLRNLLLVIKILTMSRYHVEGFTGIG